MDWRVREVEPGDADGIVGIMNPIIRASIYTAFDTPVAVQDEREYILGFPARGIFFVAENPQNKALVGFQSMEPFATYTNAFNHVGVLGTYVDLTYLRQGIASCLFQATFEAARNKGYEKIFTYIRADNQNAIAAYCKQGFRIIGEAQKQLKLKGRYVDEVIVENFLENT
jgi:L-amino acid N-acyltransferase YncA